MTATKTTVSQKKL